MSILKNKLKTNFSQLPNELITDNRLSHGAFRVAAYLFSRPDGWNILNADIQTQLGIKQSQTLADYWQELLEFGWITRERKRECGKIVGGFDYELSLIRENPQYGKTLIKENATIGETDMLNNTDKDSNNELEKNTNILPPTATKKEVQPKEFRKAVFEKSLIPYLETYGKEILRSFSDYWTESNENGNKMRFEMQKVFDKSRRLATWHKNSKDFKNAPLIPSEQKDIETIAAFFKATWHTPNPELVKELAPKIKQILQSGETMESLQRNIGMSRKVASVWGSFDFLINNYPKLKTICERYTSQNLA